MAELDRRSFDEAARSDAPPTAEDQLREGPSAWVAGIPAMSAPETLSLWVLPNVRITVNEDAVMRIVEGDDGHYVQIRTGAPYVLTTESLHELRGEDEGGGGVDLGGAGEGSGCSCAGGDVALMSDQPEKPADPWGKIYPPGSFPRCRKVCRPERREAVCPLPGTKYYVRCFRWVNVCVRECGRTI